MLQDPNKYISKYSNGKEVSAAQYITELICENKARLQKMDLHFRFWTNKTWSKFYRDQIATSNKLLKKYEPKAIIAALRDQEASKIYSLRAPHLIAIIDKHKEILDQQNKDFTLSVDRKEQKSFRTESQKKSGILSRLKDIDNDN